MDIREIKERLTMEVVLAHYGLKADKTPSLQIYPKTGTFCCFSTNCHAGTGDVIQFIELKENSSKHEAIQKAKELIAGSNPAFCASDWRGSSNLLCRTEEQTITMMDKIAVLNQVFGYFKKSLPLSKKAVEYLQGRSIHYQQHEVGYNSGGLHGESKNHHLVASMEKWGLLKARPAGGSADWKMVYD